MLGVVGPRGGEPELVLELLELLEPRPGAGKLAVEALASSVRERELGVGLDSPGTPLLALALELHRTTRRAVCVALGLLHPRLCEMKLAL